MKEICWPGQYAVGYFAPNKRKRDLVPVYALRRRAQLNRISLAFPGVGSLGGCFYRDPAAGRLSVSLPK